MRLERHGHLMSVLAMATMLGCALPSWAADDASPEAVHVDPQALHDVVLTADRMVVTTGEGTPQKEIFTSSDKKDISTFVDSFHPVVPDSDSEGRCLCGASEFIYFYRSDKKIATIKYIAPDTVSVESWNTDTWLDKPEELVRWFDARGIHHPREIYDDEQQEALKNSKPDPGYSRDYRETVLTSKEGRKYRVQLSAPKAAPLRGGWPVLYVLDGNGWFGSAVEVARMREYEKLTPTIVVGIAPAGDAFFDLARSYDFTPPGVKDSDFDGVETGGADKFLAFLTDVVRPWVHSNYGIDMHRQILFGHSLGGTFVLHTLFTSPKSFDVYLAASPDVQYGNEAVLKEAPTFESGPTRTQPRVLVTDGSLEGLRPSLALVDDYRRWYTDHPEERSGMTVEQAMAETFPPGDAGYDKIAKTRHLVDQLAKSGVQVQFVEFDGDEHMAAAISALNRGVPFALRPPAPALAPAAASRRSAAPESPNP